MKNLGVSTPVAGAGVALAAGLLLGAAMRPQLAISELSPQPIGAWSGELAPQVAAPDDSLAYAGYAGQLPTYVIGADFLAQAAPPAEPAPAPVSDEPPTDSDEGRPGDAAPAAEGHATPAAAQAADAPPQTQPADAVAAAPAIPTLAIDETSAPPEATGDTTPHEQPPTALAD